MTVFWSCKTTENAQYYKKIEYVSDPSVDLIDRFKEEIITYENPMEHRAYVPCTHVEESKGHMLFILDSRVEILIKPDRDAKKLFFMDCQDNQ